jgi:hypothetical protein
MSTPLEKLRAWLEGGREIERRATPGPWQRIDYDSDKSDPHKRVCEMFAYGDVYTISKNVKKIDVDDDGHNGSFIADARTRIVKQSEVIEALLEALNTTSNYYITESAYARAAELIGEAK